jgi:hypothetical protein
MTKFTEKRNNSMNHKLAERRVPTVTTLGDERFTFYTNLTLFII